MPEQLLLIDDEPAFAAALRTRLLAEGFAVRVATNGAAGISAALAHRPELILLDIQMPDIDGFAVCQRLKTDANTRSIPVIFMSANADDTTRSRCLATGACDFLPKPFESHTLLAAIEAARQQKADTAQHPAPGAHA